MNLNLEKIQSKKHGWWVYDNKAINPKLFWEKPEGGGLLLKECPSCGTKQFRETYLKGFDTNSFTLVQDYECTGISQCCNCGQWLRWNG